MRALKPRTLCWGHFEGSRGRGDWQLGMTLIALSQQGQKAAVRGFHRGSRASMAGLLSLPTRLNPSSIPAHVTPPSLGNGRREFCRQAYSQLDVIANWRVNPRRVRVRWIKDLAMLSIIPTFCTRYQTRTYHLMIRLRRHERAG